LTLSSSDSVSSGEIVGRSLGIDPGTKRIGIAISDELGLLARPLEVWARRKVLAEDVAHVVALIAEHEAVRVVIGVPRRLDGSIGPAAERALIFVAAVRAAAPASVEVVERDEALTTWEAENALKERGLDWKERRELIDAFAAAVILQEDLDARARQSS
jgi:putative holliday junction resolvase